MTSMNQAVIFSFDVVQQIAAYVDTTTLVHLCQVHPSFSALRPTLRQMESFLINHGWYSPSYGWRARRVPYLKDIHLLKLLLSDETYTNLRQKYLKLSAIPRPDDEIGIAKWIFDLNVPTKEDIEIMLQKSVDCAHFTQKMFVQVIDSALDRKEIVLANYQSSIIWNVMKCNPSYCFKILHSILNSSRYERKDERTLAFLMVCAGRYEEYFEQLVKDGVDATIDNNLPLRLATFGKHQSIIKRLLTSTPQVDPLDAWDRCCSPHSFGRCSLRIALENDDLDTVKLLWTTSDKWLKTQVDADKVYSVLSISLANRTSHDPNLVKYILKKTEQFKFSHEMKDAIANAARKNDLEAVKLITKDPRLDKNAVLDGALLSACEVNAVDCAKFLLEDGRANPAYGNQSAISFAAAKGSTECVKLLLEFDYEKIMRERQARRCRKRKFSCDPGANNSRALYNAAREGHEGCTRLLLQDPRVDPLAGSERALRVKKKSAARELVRQHVTAKKLKATK